MQPMHAAAIAATRASIAHRQALSRRTYGQLQCQAGAGVVVGRIAFVDDPLHLARIGWQRTQEDELPLQRFTLAHTQMRVVCGRLNQNLVASLVTQVGAAVGQAGEDGFVPAQRNADREQSGKFLHIAFMYVSNEICTYTDMEKAVRKALDIIRKKEVCSDGYC